MRKLGFTNRFGFLMLPYVTRYQ